MATHSSVLAWRIPWTEEPGGLQSMGSLRVGHDWSNNTHKRKKPIWKDYELCDVLKKANMDTVKRSVAAEAWDRRQGGEQVEPRGCFRQWNYSTWCYNDGYTQLYACPNPWKAQHQDWAWRKLWTLGGDGVSVLVHQSQQTCHLVGMLTVGEVTPWSDRGYLGICTFLSILLWIQGCYLKAIHCFKS